MLHNEQWVERQLQWPIAQRQNETIARAFRLRPTPLWSLPRHSTDGTANPQDIRQVAAQRREKARGTFKNQF